MICVKNGWFYNLAVGDIQWKIAENLVDGLTWGLDAFSLQVLVEAQFGS
jgi:hypothetical protein